MVSEVVGEAVVRIREDQSGFDPDAAGKKAGKGYAGGFSSSIKGLAGGIAATLAVGKGIDVLRSSVGEAREGQKVAAATTQIIKATGGAAKISADQVGELSGAISAKTGVDDEAIQSGQNLLLTFKNVANAGEGQAAIFDRASESAVNLSAAGFGSITGASVMLGKALNDPTKGISALGRAGVTFTQAQKDQVKALQESGDILGAQKIILKEVEGQVGGVAEATATAGEKATVAWGNVQETLGGVLLPMVDTVANAFTNTLAPALTSGIEALPGLLSDVKAFGSDVSRALSFAFGDDADAQVDGFAEVMDHAFGNTGRFIGPLRSVSGVIQEVRGAVGGLLSSFNSGQASEDGGIVGLATMLGAALRNDVMPVVQTAAGTFRAELLPALKDLGGYVVSNVLPVVGALAQTFIQDVIPTIATVATFIYGTLYPALISIAVAVATRLKPVLDTLIEVFLTRIIPTVQRVANQIRTDLVPALLPLISKVVAITGFLLKLAAAILGRVLPPLLRFAGFLIANVVPAVVTVITWIVRFTSGLLDLIGVVGRAIAAAVRFALGLDARVTGAVANVVSAITQLPGKILGLGPKMLSAGRSLIGKFVDGMKNAGGIVSGIAGNVWSAVKGLLNGAIDRINAALEFKISLPGPDISINPPNIPHLARGTRNWQGGWAMTGEEGPELIRLPRGAQVFPAQETERMLAPAAAAAGGEPGAVYIGTMMPHNYGEFTRQIHESHRLAALGGPRALTGAGAR